MTMAGSIMEDEMSFIPECDIYTAEGPDDEQRLNSCGCGKNFIGVHELRIDNLPEGCRNERRMRALKTLIDRTIKIRILHTSENRPDFYPGSTDPYPYAKYKGKTDVRRCGSGWIPNNELTLVKNEECPCHLCDDTRKLSAGTAKMGYFRVWVRTAAHVVYDEYEASRAKCEVFFNSPDRKEVKTLYGVGQCEDWWGRKGMDAVYDTTKRCMEDWFDVMCVSHDMELYEMLKSMSELNLGLLKDLHVIVSHPHGHSKTVSFGAGHSLVIQLTGSHSPEVPYILQAACTEVYTEMDVMSFYPGFFRKHPDTDTRYNSTQPLKLYIKSDSSQPTRILCDDKHINCFHLPKYCILTSMDEQIVFEIESFTFDGSQVLHALRENIKYFHYTYDIPTCKGSSGAYIPTMTTIYPMYLRHAGVLANGNKRSGDYKYY